VVVDNNALAKGLGYLVGTGAVLLYTPIAVRIFRQKSADGLALSTWWLKLTSYTCTILYNFDKGYPVSTYAETAVLAAESTSILVLVAYYQRELGETSFLSGVFAFVVFVGLALSDAAPQEVLTLGQAVSAVLNVGALLPQFVLNARTQTGGDYSPLTAGLALAGCTIRLFTTVQLADSDPLLLRSFGLALVLNGALLSQILYYGIRYEGKSLGQVLTADYNVNNDNNNNNTVV
jgi:mannose-P-dolichol utilization defect protein 1